MNNNDENDENNEYDQYDENFFELKYLEDISDLFNEFKGMDNYYGLNLFKDNYCDFFDFMKKNIIFYEFLDEDFKSESDEDNYLHIK